MNLSYKDFRSDLFREDQVYDHIFNLVLIIFVIIRVS